MSENLNAPAGSEPLTNAKTSNISPQDSSTTPKKIVKPPKLEDKPFDEFINDHMIPTLSKQLKEKGVEVTEISLQEGARPVTGGNCWFVYLEISQGRRVWLCFNEPKITSQKTIALAERVTEASLIESFLIDEKKTTLPLLVSRLLQRLNGQKWLADN